jgi:hypothetical protein
MPDKRSLQSEQLPGQQFNALMIGFSGLSATISHLLMQYIATQLIQLSKNQQTVKLSETLVAGVPFTADPRGVVEKLTDRLNEFYKGYASQLTMTMLHGKQFSNSAAMLNSASQKLDGNLGKLHAVNETHKNQFGKDASVKKDDYQPPKPKPSI